MYLIKRKKILNPTVTLMEIGIDGKLVYVHRANVDIIPASLFQGN